MKSFVSWSGGKDCMLALHRIQQQKEHQVTGLLNMCDVDGEHSRSHGIHKSLIKEQAKALQIPILQPMSTFNTYEEKFKESIEDMKHYGVEAGVFGDIYLQPHRDWIERVCTEMKIQALFPIWGENTNDLLQEFIQLGFKSKLVAVNAEKLDQSWLGKIVTPQFLEDIGQLEGIDACAENGEYHSFVFNGPNFTDALKLISGEAYKSGKHWFLPLNID